ncbi:MAG TPA: glycosyltransferase family 2 protein [Candidatus Norongarragalinales archaeon]|jgi:glycosyltransferase involved in cell wall biosynthesis|nr:glycosyltransferase family 2 protein [Candidatus Norongarragalinales archaeon]
MSRRPALSVIIPAFNASDTLGSCLEALKRSSFKNFETIIVDDASTDNTSKIAKAYGAKVIRFKTNQGPAAARNAGAKKAKAPVLFFLDSDTRPWRDALEKTVRTLKEPGVGAVVGVYSAQPTNPGFWPKYFALLKHHSHVQSGRVENYETFAGQCAAVKKSFFQKAGGYKPLAWGVDVEHEELGRRLNESGCRIVLNPEVVVDHKFGDFEKLKAIHYRRSYWWTRFFLSAKNKKFESALTTRDYAIGTIAGSSALGFTALFALSSAFNVTLVPALSIVGAIVSLAVYSKGYAGFLGFVNERAGSWFAARSFIASLLLSLFVTAGAGAALAAHVSNGGKSDL